MSESINSQASALPNAANLTVNSADHSGSTEKKSKKLFPRLVILAIVIAMIIGIIYYFTVFRYFEKTDNAYVKADVTWVMPRVSGEITSLLVKDNQVVKAGQVLMKLDDRDTQARYAQAQAMVNIKEAAIGVQQRSEERRVGKECW